MSLKILSEAFTRLLLLFERKLSFILLSLILAGILRAAGDGGEYRIAPSKDFSSKMNLTFEQIFLDEGLSQSIVKCVAQDSLGFMWFGTEDGLNKYDGYKFTVLKRDPGNQNSLGTNDVTALHVDKRGILWIGTFYGGLDRYDQKFERFTHYRYDPENPNSLSNDNINVIFEDRQGILWIGTDLGLNKFHPEDTAVTAAVFTRYLHHASDPKSLSNNYVRAVCQDDAGGLWVGTDDGLNRLNPETGEFVHYRNEPGNPFSLSQNEVTSLYYDSRGMLWVGTRSGGLNRLDVSGAITDRFIRYLHNPNDPFSLSHNQVNKIFEDDEGNLWIGTHGGGLSILDRETDKFISFRTNPLDQSSISYDEIMDIYEDRSGLLWLGTYGGGIDKIDRSRKQFSLYRSELNRPNSLGHPIVWSIYEDASGILWIGTHGGGMDRLDRNTSQYTHFRNNPDDLHTLSSDIVRFIFEDRDGVFWIGTHGGGLCRFHRETGKFEAYRHDPANPSSLSHDELRSIFQDRSGTIWVGTNGGGLNKMVPGSSPASAPSFVRYKNDPADPNSLSNDFVRVIYEDQTGDFWIGTQGGGLEKMERETGTFVHYRVNPGQTGGLNSNSIFAIHESKDGILWLGTWGGGLNKFDKSKNTFTAFTTEDGLPSNAIYGILEDGEGNLWMSTNNGLCKFNPDNKTFRNFTEADGLQSNEFNGGAFFKSAGGEMFFGGIDGFNSFYPSQIRSNPFIPPVVITAFQKLNRDVKFDQSISEMREMTLSYKDYVFSLEFAALDYTAPGKNLYAYKMDGLDEDWIYTDSRKRFATYTTLAPGTYVFRVKGSNNDGIWNETGSSLKIVITPPFWKTGWFILLAGLVAAAILIISYRRRLRNVRLKAELQAAHDAQMTIMPHTDPVVEGFEISGICLPANEVGGDFFDYFWLDKQKTRFGVAIGDVSGKAMKSAMTAVMASGMICSRTNEDLPVFEIMTRMNLPLINKTRKNVFIALCLASLDVRSRSLTFTNAGLDRPLLKTDGRADFLESEGAKFPLGTVADTVYQEKRLSLNSGDVLILNTDGVTEARNVKRELYSEINLRRLLEGMDTASLSATQIKERIIADVRQFAGNETQNDDMTVIVVKVV
ncbi:MAG: two-component regulator propeller domain-containing protein [Calditrichia bacterium]